MKFRDRIFQVNDPCVALLFDPYTEQVFAWAGMGALFIRGLNAVDVNLVMGYVMIVGLMAVIGNVIADLLYSALDPRIRIS